MINNESRLDRRAFLTTTGALLVSLAAPAGWSEAAANGAATRPPVKGDQLDSYITIDPDGTVVAYYGKIDGGQGLGTSIAQMVAEEIDVPYERVRVVMGDSALTMDMGGASAAVGISHGGMVLRRTAAEARRLLIEMASRKLGVAVEQLTVTDGVVHGTADAGKRVSYAELIGGRYFEAPVNWNGKTSSQLAVEVKVPLKTHDQFKVIGQSFPRRDLPGKVFGTLEYGQRRAAAGNAACAHDPPAGRGRGAGQCRRELDQGHPGRQGGLDQGFPRRRRRQGMERGEGRQGAEGDLVGIHAELSRA